MGITIHYRGRMDDVAQIEEMEDRVVDLTFALGGKATVGRSYADDDPSRVIRCLMLDMAAGQETMSLLISPEGDLISLFEIEAAEKQPFAEPPGCFVKTQFRSLQGHIAVVCLLDALQDRYFSNLEINDESGYHENRDHAALIDKRKQLTDAISAMSEGLQEYGLSDEAAEDPEILATRIERVAQLVRTKIGEPDESKPSDSEGDESDSDNLDDHELTLEEEVVEAERLHRKNQLRSERMSRRIEEASAQGLSTEEAFELAMSDEGLSPPTGDRKLIEKPSQSDPWRESLPDHAFDESEFPKPEKHPAVAKAESILMEFMKIPAEIESTNNFVTVATRGLMDIIGGLVQATTEPNIERYERAHSIVQLKRALKGHGFARGAVFGLRDCEAIGKETIDRMHDELESILESIHQLLAEVWDESEM